MLPEFNAFSAFQFAMILYLTIADGLNNPIDITKLYSQNVMVRYLYTLFGAYNVFGSEVGMNLGLKTSVAVSAAMMLLLDLIPMYMQSKQDQKAVGFVPLFSQNSQSYMVVALFFYLYFMM